MPNENPSPELTLETMQHGRDDPEWFMTHILDVNPDHFWPKMREMVESVRDNERTAVGAGHGVSKTYTMGRLALWFLYCYCPSTVVTTAPTDNQVKNLLWREIRNAHSGARHPLGGKIHTKVLDLQEDTGLRWFATGFATRADTVTKEATAFQGYHNDSLLIIMDEAAGILPEIWKASEHIGAPHKRFVCVGNPTASVGEFANALKDSSYNHINISVTDTPNFKNGNDEIPGLYGVEYERRIRAKYGIESDEYRVRVKGLVSRKGVPGAYYGDVVEYLEKTDRITKVHHNRHYPVYVIIDPGYTSAMWFVQAIGVGQLRLIRYYEDMGMGMDGYARLFRELQREEGYEYAKIIVPCDTGSKATATTTGETALETLKDMVFNVESLPIEVNVIEGIDRTVKMLYNCWIDKDNCKTGIDRLKGYHEKQNKAMSTEDEPVFTGRPEKDGNDHGADALRYVSLAAKKNLFVAKAARQSSWKKKKAEHAY